MDCAFVAEEIGRVQHVDMKRVALNPLAAVNQPPQRAQWAVDANAACVLHRVDSAHLVGDWTDSADARGDIWRFGKVASAEKCFEEAGRLKNFKFNASDFAFFDLYPHRALAFDTREVIDFNGTRLIHEPRFPCGRRRRTR